jgi:hypothetical protein
MMAASSPATQFWRDRGPMDWARVLPTYWGATAQPHRASLIASLRKQPRFESLRELGCCAGTNIAMIRQVFPWAAVEGLEVSPEASLFAQDKFAADPAVRITCTDILYEAEVWDPGEVDVTISCYALAYIAPEDLDDLLVAAVRASSKGLVIVEPMYGDIGRIPVHYTAEWRHDYTQRLDRILAAAERPASLVAEKLDNPVEQCDGIVAVTFL